MVHTCGLLYLEIHSKSAHALHMYIWGSLLTGILSIAITAPRDVGWLTRCLGSSRLTLKSAAGHVTPSDPCSWSAVETARKETYTYTRQHCTLSIKLMNNYRHSSNDLRQVVQGIFNQRGQNTNRAHRFTQHYIDYYWPFIQLVCASDSHWSEGSRRPWVVVTVQLCPPSVSWRGASHSDQGGGHAGGWGGGEEYKCNL